jgi:hypothetical protein
MSDLPWVASGTVNWHEGGGPLGAAVGGGPPAGHGARIKYDYCPVFTIPVFVSDGGTSSWMPHGR